MRLLTALLLCLSLNSYAQTAGSYFTKAEKLFKEKKYAAALQLTEKALALDSTQLDYYDLKAQCHTELKQWQQVYDAYTKGLMINPKASYFYNYRGNFLISSGNFDEAIADFDNGIPYAENDSIQFVLILNRGSAKTLKRDFEGAYKDFMSCYSFDSTNVGVLTNLGSVCDETGRKAETLKYLEKALALEPTSIPAIGNIGFKYQEMGDYKTAIKYFNRALALAPNDGQCYGNRGYNKLKLGDIKGAKQDLEKAIQLYPANSYAYRIRALIYIEEKQYAKACADLQTALDKGFTVSYGNEVQELKEKYCK